jgi:putative transposase
MAVPKRHKRVPGTYFVTSRTWESRAIFKAAQPCEIFVASLMHYRDQGAYQLLEFVLMPDHFHVLLTPAADTALERAVQFIKGGSAKAIRDALSFRFPVWQRGFSDHRIRDLADYESHVRYIDENPAKKLLAMSAGEYPWCSARGTFRMDDVPQGLKPLTQARRIGTAEAVP